MPHIHPSPSSNLLLQSCFGLFGILLSPFSNVIELNYCVTYWVDVVFSSLLGMKVPPFQSCESRGMSDALATGQEAHARRKRWGV